MRNLSGIALSMMVVVLAVAAKSALAQEAVPEAAPADVAPKADDGASDGDEATPKRTRKPATAQEQSSAQRVEEPKFFGGPAQPNHRLQTGLSIMPGTGYRLIVPYKENQFCGDSSGQQTKRVCAHSVPAFLDIQLSFGVASRADLIVDLRFGLQGDPAAGGRQHQFALAPGLRFWLDQAVALKFYTTLQFVYDHTNFSGSDVRSSDYGVRNANGLMYDPIRNVGFFVQFGETFAFARWFRIDLDVGVGAQLRFP